MRPGASHAACSRCCLALQGHMHDPPKLLADACAGLVRSAGNALRVLMSSRSLVLTCGGRDPENSATACWSPSTTQAPCLHTQAGRGLLHSSATRSPAAWGQEIRKEGQHLACAIQERLGRNAGRQKQTSPQAHVPHVLLVVVVLCPACSGNSCDLLSMQACLMGGTHPST